MRSYFRCSEDEDGFGVIDNTFMSMSVILLKRLALVFLIVFSNVGSGSNFAASVLLFVLSRSKFLSKDSGTLETINCNLILTHISLIDSVAYERYGGFKLRGYSYSSICLDS